MTGQQLKNSILQLAIQGKLVPQDPHDEPSSELLKRIRKEKEQLVKEGKLKKKDLQVTPITEDEKPFEIPEGWVWCRLGEIVKNRDSERVPLAVSVRERQVNRVYDYYGPGGAFDKVDNYLFDKRLLLVGEDGANLLTRSKPNAFFADGKYWVNNHVHVLDSYLDDEIILDYVSKRINGMSLADYVTGTAQPKMNQEKMNSISIPLPPLAEQHRIVAKIEELMPLVEEYDKSQKELNELNSNLPEALKKSILQEAIMGKLGTNDPTDEPASELLKRIQAEKARLIKEKKIKKEKPLPEITEDEKPFEIPENWVWCRLRDICTKIVDGDHNPPSGTSIPTQYKMLSSRNINFDQIVDLDSVRYLSKEIFEEENKRTLLQVGDILLTTVGTLGRSCILKEYEYYVFQRSVSIITTLAYNKFIKRTLDAPFIQQIIDAQATGTAQRGFYLNQLEKLLIPLPPLAEQHRIIEKLETILPKLKEI